MFGPPGQRRAGAGNRVGTAPPRLRMFPGCLQSQVIMQHPFYLEAGATSSNISICFGVQKQEEGCEVGCSSLREQVTPARGWER